MIDENLVVEKETDGRGMPSAVKTGAKAEAEEKHMQ